MNVTKRDSIHVAINGHLLSGDETYRSAGVHRYIRRLVSNLTTQDGLKCTVLTHSTAALDEINATAYRSRWPTQRPLVRILWEQLVQPGQLRRIGADVVHGPVNVLPLVRTCPAVVTLHDLSFIRFPQLFRPSKRLYQKVMTRLSVLRADRVIAVSAHTAREACQLLGVPMEHIDVVYHGVEPTFRPLSAAAVERFRTNRSLPKRYILSVGTLEPRKNLVRLVQAFSRIDQPDLYLVLAGARGWLYEDLFATVEAVNLNSRVLFLGYVDNHDLPLLYNAAEAMAFPSLYEGFGLPVIEAQACGTPVLTSGTTSLPEAAGEAAYLVDPSDVDAIAEGLDQIVSHQKLRDELKTQGLRNASRFDWSATAQATSAVYQRAVHRKGVS